MPNHIKNRMTINATPEVVESIYNEFNTYVPASIYKSMDGRFICKDTTVEGFSCGWLDPHTGVFEQRGLTPQNGIPQDWEVEIKPEVNAFPDFKKVIPPPLDPVYDSKNSQDHNPNWWYNWNRQNWGTKWNSYHHEKEKWNVFTFNTAWNSPVVIIKQMSLKFPDVEFTLEYSDEDTGYNCGELKIGAGIALSENIPEGGSKEAYDLAFKLRPNYREYYKLVDGEYEAIEDED